MKSYFFNAEPTTDLEAHSTGYDREYDADSQAEFWEPFFTGAGVFAGTNKDACKVTVASQGADVVLGVAEGAVYAKGRVARFDGTETVSTRANCSIVARMNKTADVRAFQLLAVTELVQTEDVYDVELGRVVLTPVMGGYEARVTDTRPFIAFTGQPPYYPPDSTELPYMLWLYVTGLPMTPEQKAAVEANPSLMEIFYGSRDSNRFGPVTATVPVGSWAGTGPWTQTVPVTGVVARYESLGVYPVDITDSAARKLYEKAYNCLAPEAETVNGGVKLTCRDAKPETNFQIMVKGVR